MWNETDRLAALRRYGILDTPAEAAFDALVEGVRRLCDVPIALVSLVDADRQWFKARAGTDIAQTPRCTAVCDLTIRGDGILEIEDLAADPRTAVMTLVAGEAGLRFYAGAPLVDADGLPLGSLCAIDVRPRPGGLTAIQRLALETLAGQAMALIALAAGETQRRARAAEDRYHAIVESAIDSAIISFGADRRVTSWSVGAERLFGWTAAEVLGEPGDRLFTPEARAAGVVEREFEEARARGHGSDRRWMLRKDDSRFYAHGAMTPLRGAPDGGYVKLLRDVTDELETRDALIASREKLELATRAARLGQFDYAPLTGGLEWDDRCRALFGLPPAAPVSYEGTFLAGLHPDDRDHADAAVRATLDAIGPREFDVEYRTIGIEDGIERHIHARGLSFVEDGRAVRLIGTVQDVSADRRARAVLRETEERLRLAVRATNDAIWDWDLVRDHVAWNDAITTAYGHALATVAPTGGWWIEHIHPDDRARVHAGIHAVIDGGGSDWTDEYRFRRADGSYADVRDRGSVLRDADGRAIRMLGAMLDQSEGKSRERGLAQQVERLWDAAPDLLVVMDASGRYLRTNPAWEAILGYAAADLAGVDATALVHPDDVAATAQALEVAQVTQLPSFENRFRHRDGSYRWFAWVTAPGDGEIFASGRDITQEVAARETLRQTEEALRQAQKVEAIGQLTGGVAHDFNNLLTVIRGSVDLLRRPDLPEERRRRYVDAIADTADRASRLTSQLLAFARRSALQPQAIDAGAAVAALAPMLRTLAGSRIVASYDLPAAPVWVSVDPSQFDTAIVNIAVNARDAMDGAGRLAIAVRTVDALPAIRGHGAVPGRYVAVSIADSGTGIAPDRIAHIFEPFFTTKGVGHGTGLGLSQVFGFAKQSDGEVAVESVEGEGATFTLYLPAIDEPAALDPTDPVRRALRADACVLVVEDNEEVGEFATAALAELGYGSHWEADAAGALAELERHPDRYDVVFTDVVMPGASGVDLAGDIRRRWPALPVVLTSGYSHVLAQSGARGFPLLHKPYSIDELARALDAVAEPAG